MGSGVINEVSDEGSDSSNMYYNHPDMNEPIPKASVRPHKKRRKPKTRVSQQILFRNQDLLDE